jgi:hypothetical protein
MISAMLLMVLLFGAPPPQAPRYRILSECDPEAAEVRAEPAKNSRLEVRYAIPGSPTCYSVTGSVDGTQVSGYILGRGLDAVEAFESRRAAAERAAFRAAAPPVPAEPVLAAQAPLKPPPAKTAVKKEVARAPNVPAKSPAGDLKKDQPKVTF